MSSTVEQPTPVEENRYHSYEGSAIPWYIRVMWLGFWIFAIALTLKYLIPAIQVELVNPP